MTKKTAPKTTKKTATKKTATPKERAVLITTAHRGVFFGYAADTSGDRITLLRARSIPRWRNTRGFLGLASAGPNQSCRVGPAADIVLTAITCVAECTPEAAAAWERAPWAT
jgi:hypothetical protein